MLSALRLWGGKKMAKSTEDPRSFEALERRIKAILPEEYQDSYETVEPVSMGSAGLKYGQDGKVVWDDMWDTFCDLAMAGGPPHKGKLLEAASREEIAAQPQRYKEVVEEICRGIRMVTPLAVMPSPVPGWVRVDCGTSVTAGWMARAIVMENVSARCEDTLLDLPAGPAFRIEKEIKNVITVVAKAGHYWIDHTGPAQQRAVSKLFAEMALEFPLIQPAVPNHDFDVESDRTLRLRMAGAIQEAVGLTPLDLPCAGWLGVGYPNVRAAIWMMRAMVASNVLARREETVLFVPVNPVTDPSGNSTVQVLSRIHSFAKERGILD